MPLLLRRLPKTRPEATRSCLSYRVPCTGERGFCVTDDQPGIHIRFFCDRRGSMCNLRHYFYSVQKCFGGLCADGIFLRVAIRIQCGLWDSACRCRNVFYRVDRKEKSPVDVPQGRMGESAARPNGWDRIRSCKPYPVLPSVVSCRLSSPFGSLPSAASSASMRRLPPLAVQRRSGRD